MKSMSNKSKLIISIGAIIGITVFLVANNKDTARDEAVKLNDRAIRLFLKEPLTALEMLNKAIVSDPTYQRAYANKATLLLQRLNRQTEALSTMNTLIKMAPHVPESYVARSLSENEFCGNNFSATFDR